MIFQLNFCIYDENFQNHESGKASSALDFKIAGVCNCGLIAEYLTEILGSTACSIRFTV